MYLLFQYRQDPPLSSSMLHSTRSAVVGESEKMSDRIKRFDTTVFFIFDKSNLKRFDGLKPIPSSLTPRRAAPAPVSFHEADNLMISPAA